MNFEMKMLYLAIRLNISSTLSVTTFSLLPRITSSFETNKQTNKQNHTHQYDVSSYYEAIPAHQTNSLGFWDSPGTDASRYLKSLYRRHRQGNLPALAERESDQWVAVS